MDEYDFFDWSSDASFSEPMPYESVPEPGLTSSEYDVGAIDDFINSSTPVTQSSFDWSKIFGGVSQLLTTGIQTAAAVNIAQTRAMPTSPYMRTTATATAPRVVAQQQQYPRWLMPALIAGGAYFLLK